MKVILNKKNNNITFQRSQKRRPHLSKICFFLLYRILCSSCTHHNLEPPRKTIVTPYNEYEEEYQHEHRRAIIDEYYKRPALKWTHQLGLGKIHSSHSLRRGNGVIVSEDNDQLFITTDDGTLHILHAHHPSTSRTFVSSLGEKHNRKGWYTFCQSMVSLRHTEERIPRVIFGVYAVVDVPPSKSVERERSRIIAVNHLARQLWSTIIPGVAVGTPVISPGGKYIYLTHNVHDEMVGYVTILSVEQDGRIVRSERNKNGDVPFGALSSIVSYDDKDVLYFGESPGRGFHEEGIVHKLMVGDGDSESGGGLSFEWELLRQTRWSVGVAAPTVSKNGRKLWISGTGGWMRGVTGDLNLSHQMMWKADLDASSRNRTQPLYNQAVLSSDEQFLYVASSGTSFYCLKADTGEVIWKNPEEGHSVYLTQAKLSHDNTKLFTIAHSDGTVSQQDTQTGKIKWQFNCASTSFDPNCADSVEAEFSLSPDGSTIYYGDIFGKITALVIGSTPPPTPFPSASPTSSQRPTQRPTNYPTMFPTSEPTQFPSISPTNHPTSTNNPTSSPSSYPTLSPTNKPSTEPTFVPTMNPTITSNPTVSPTITISPSNEPTLSFQPSLSTLSSQPPTNIYNEGGGDGDSGVTWGRGVLFLGLFCLGVSILICLLAGSISRCCGRNERRKA